MLAGHPVARARRAQVLVVNYAAILPESGCGCWPQVPIAFADVPVPARHPGALNTMLATQAGANGATIVDAYTATIGNDACKSSGTRWVEPLVPGNAAAPFHPNARGMAGIAVVAAGPLARLRSLRRRGLDVAAGGLRAVGVPAHAALAVGGADAAEVQRRPSIVPLARISQVPSARLE